MPFKVCNATIALVLVRRLDMEFPLVGRRILRQLDLIAQGR